MRFRLPAWALLFAVQLLVGAAMLFAALGVLSLTACATSDPGEPVQSATAVPGWSIWSSGSFSGLSDALGGLVQFNFPQGNPALVHIDYVTRTHTGPLSGSLSVTYTVVGNADLEPNTTGFTGLGAAPPDVHLFFAVPGYSVDGAPAHNTQRWWSLTEGTLSPGVHTLTVPLVASDWLDVNGIIGSAAQSGFSAALANVGSVGITFGAVGGPAGHGVAAVSGSSSLTINSLAAQ